MNPKPDKKKFGKKFSWYKPVVPQYNNSKMAIGNTENASHLKKQTSTHSTGQSPEGR